MISEKINKDFSKVVTIGNNIPVGHFILADQRSSGFIQEGTERLPEPIELTAPSIWMARNTSHYFKKDDNGTPRRVDIRYIFGVDEIEVEKQKEKGFVPNPTMDTIIFRKGKLVVAREGNYIGLYDYLQKCSYNALNPDRNPATDIRFVEIFPEKQKATSNDKDFAIAEAIALINKELITARNGEQITYDEQKLDSYCKLFDVYAEYNPGKIGALVSVAKADPEGFVSKVRLFESRFITEIVHAEELNLIQYRGNTVEYVGKPDIIFSLPGSFLKKEVVREKLAAFFQSQEGAVAYQKFLAELETAKKQSLN